MNEINLVNSRPRRTWTLTGEVPCGKFGPIYVRETRRDDQCPGKTGHETFTLTTRDLDPNSEAYAILWRSNTTVTAKHPAQKKLGVFTLIETDYHRRPLAQYELRGAFIKNLRYEETSECLTEICNLVMDVVYEKCTYHAVTSTANSVPRLGESLAATAKCPKCQHEFLPDATADPLA